MGIAVSLIAESHRGKRMTGVLNESYLCALWNAASQFQISYRRTLDGNANGRLERKTRYAYPEERALDNALLRGIYDDAAQNFGNVTHADSRTENMRGCGSCVRFRACVYASVRATTFSGRIHPAHQIPLSPTLLVFSVFLHSVLAFSFAFFFFRYFSYVNVALSVFRASWSKTIAEERTRR